MMFDTSRLGKLFDVDRNELKQSIDT